MSHGVNGFIDDSAAEKYQPTFIISKGNAKQ